MVWCLNGLDAADGTLRTPDRGDAFLLGSDPAVWHAAEDLLCRGHDLVLAPAQHPHFRLPEVRRAVPQPAAGECRAVGGGKRLRHRVCAQTQPSQGRSGQGNSHSADHPGLVCILSAMEPCSTYKPWHNKQTGKTYLRPDEGKCLHYYFYFIDQALGLGYVRVPTWLPCRLQVYFNGHSWLANLLRQRNIGFRLIDNAFVEIADWQRAQHIADGLQIKRLHRRLDEMAHRF